MIPTDNEIEKLKNKIKKRKERYKELIQLLNEWEIKLYNKIEELKKKLIYEIEFMEKMFYNFNKCFTNYTYFKNFEYFSKYMSDSNLSIFNKCYTFKDMEDILEKLFEKEEVTEESKLKERDLNENFLLIDGIIKKINDKYIFIYSNNSDKVKISSLNKNGSINALDKALIDFDKRTFSVSVSLKNKKVYATLVSSRKVIIFNFDLENELMEKSKDVIEDNEERGRFNKCIEISDELTSTADNQSIIIWKKDITGYINVKEIDLGKETNDLLLINNEYFVSTQANEKTITFVNISNLKEDKIIERIDCTNDNNCLFLFKNFLIVNCEEGIAFISLETKEVIQYIQNFDNIRRNKSLFIYANDNDFLLYILNRLISENNAQKYDIKIMKFEDGQLKLVKKSKENEIYIQGKLHITALNNTNTILIWGNKI